MDYELERARKILPEYTELRPKAKRPRYGNDESALPFDSAPTPMTQEVDNCAGSEETYRAVIIKHPRGVTVLPHKPIEPAVKKIIQV